MGSRVSVLLFGMLSLAAVSACAADLTFTFASNNQSGSATNLPPDADPPCLQPNCVLFSGTLTDTDTDSSFLFLQSLSVEFSSSNPSASSLSLDNSFDFDVPGVLAGDPGYAADNSGNPPNLYVGPVFGIDIAPGAPAGVYTGTITINAAGGTGDPANNGFTLTQSFTVTVSPAAQTITFGAPTNQTFGAAPFPLSATASSGLTVTFTSNTMPVCTVSGAEVTIVAVGACSITASQTGNANYAAAAPVTQSFTVSQAASGPEGGGGGGTTGPSPNALTLSPASLTFTTVVSGTSAPQTITLTDTAGSVSYNVNTSYGATWLSVSPTSGVTASQPTLTVTVNTGGLNPGTYTATINVGAGASFAETSVTLTITAQPITASPASLTFTYQAGGPAAAPPSQTIAINSNPSNLTYAASASTTSGGNWLVIPSNAGGTTPGSLAVSVNPAALSAGTYSGQVAITPATGSPVAVPVTLTVQAAVTVAPSPLNFTYQSGTASLPAEESISVFSSPSGVSFTASAASTGNWLTASGTGTTPGSVAVSVDVSKLTAGTYTGSVTISSASAASVVVPVTITVSAATPSVLSVSPGAETFSLAQGAAPSSGQVTVSDTGGGTLQFTAQAASDKGWLALNGSGSGSAMPSAPASLGFKVNPSGLNPGLYSGRITVSDSNSSKQALVSVILTIANTAQSIQLSQNGLTVNVVAGGAQPQAQSFTVSNSGAGTLNWTAQTSTLSGGAWLSVSPGSGASVSGQAGIPVSVSANTTGLAAGQYYGSINVASAGAANSPQLISVVLNVVASQASPGEAISTGGLLLVGSPPTLQQTVSVFNPSSSAVSYTASTFTANGTGWLSVIPSSGAVSPGANAIQIVANPKLIAAIQTGTVRLSFDDGGVGTIQVVLVLPGGGTVTPGSGTVRSAMSRPLQEFTTCPDGKATFLIPMIQQPVTQAVIQVAKPQTLQMEVIDDCGNPVTAGNGGSVQVAFNSGDAGLVLHDVGSGIWEATWTPVSAASQVILQAAASEQGLTPNPALNTGSSVMVTVQAASAGAAPQPAGGVANAASAGQAIPQVVAPGSYISIYGTGLGNAGSVSATTVPLAATLDGAQFFLGGQPMPLFYASPGQVNALVPQGLAPNAAYPLAVIRGTTQSVPVPLTVTELQPGIYTVNLSGSGPGVVTNALTGILNTASNPAQASDYLTIYCTGLGAVQGPNGEAEPADGAAAPLNLIYRTNATVTATVGGVPATVSFAGLAPGFVGLYQVNVQVPAGVAAGNNIPLVLTATDSQTGITAESNSVNIAVQ